MPQSKTGKTEMSRPYKWHLDHQKLTILHPEPSNEKVKAQTQPHPQKKGNVEPMSVGNETTSSVDQAGAEERPATTSRSSNADNDSDFYKEVLRNPEQYPKDVVEDALDEDLKH